MAYGIVNTNGGGGANGDDLDSLNTSIQNVKYDTEDIKKDATSLKTDSSSILAKIATLLSDHTEIKNAIAAVKTVVDAIKTVVDGLKTSVANVKSDTTALRTDTANIILDTTTIKSDAATNKSLLQNSTYGLSALQKAIAAAKSVIDTIKSATDSLSTKTDTLTTTVKKVSEQTGDIRAAGWTHVEAGVSITKSTLTTILSVSGKGELLDAGSTGKQGSTESVKSFIFKVTIDDNVIYYVDASSSNRSTGDPMHAAIVQASLMSEAVNTGNDSGGYMGTYDYYTFKYCNYVSIATIPIFDKNSNAINKQLTTFIVYEPLIFESSLKIEALAYDSSRTSTIANTFWANYRLTDD